MRPVLIIGTLLCVGLLLSTASANDVAVAQAVVPDRAEVTAEVKLETFPYTRYGTVGAKVLSVAADAVISESARQPQNSFSGNGNTEDSKVPQGGDNDGQAASDRLPAEPGARAPQ